ncbi:hypothetical protein Tco_0919420 [Tanacetum coccineum]
MVGVLGPEDTWLPEEGPFDEFPAETDEEDEDSDMSLQFQRPKGPDVNYVPKNIAKSPTFILNAVIGVANKTTWAMIEQKMEKRGAGNKGKGKEKVSLFLILETRSTQGH